MFDCDGRSISTFVSRRIVAQEGAVSHSLINKGEAVKRNEN